MLLAIVNRELPEMIRFRRDLHSHPETGTRNPRTQQKILDAIGNIGLDIEVGRTCTSVTATLHGSKPGPNILLRADTDALPMAEDSGLSFSSRVPDAAHACGHDAHTAMLVAAAKILATDLRNRVSGTIRFVFQPGEEACGGAQAMLDDGLFSQATDEAFALHVTPNIPTGMVASRSGPFFASCDEFEIVLTGRGGHASMPHTCIDPIPGAFALGSALLGTVARGFDPFSPVVVSIGAVNSGTTSNVIPDTATIRGTLRTFDADVQARAWSKITHLTSSIATTQGLTGSSIIRYSSPVTVNSEETTRRFLEHATALFGASQVVEMESPIMASEDFGIMLQHAPGTLVLVGACPEGVSDPVNAEPCHSSKMVINENCMVTGTALHIVTALGGPSSLTQ
ncbi:M20 metallopeptidase family protein [Nocardia camponoti]|uniref:Hippurate hydrolase n=1 Tax=Nocardia camponoti TaxID=1616106 RepID=A0A917Q829_9NOCA|nr:M20 family metallopeptidase [Nocardia camponoti]GGK34307.1 hippurate hydrolase [Nocardia camponoti]